MNKLEWVKEDLRIWVIAIIWTLVLSLMNRFLEIAGTLVKIIIGVTLNIIAALFVAIYARFLWKWVFALYVFVILLLWLEEKFPRRPYVHEFRRETISFLDDLLFIPGVNFLFGEILVFLILG